MNTESVPFDSTQTSTGEVTATSKRFGVSDLFWLIAFVAVFLQYARQSVGLGDYLIHAAVLAAFVFAGIRMAPTSPKALILTLAFCFLLLGLVSNWFSVAYAVLLCASSVVQSKGDALYRLRWHTCLLGVALVAGNVLNWASPPWRLERLYETRQQFPIVDLSNRLVALRPAVPTAISENQKKDLAELTEVYDERTIRNYNLEQIHSQTYETFAQRIGFGAERMMSMHPERVQVPTLKEIPFRFFEPSKSGYTSDVEEKYLLNLDLKSHPLLSFRDVDSLYLQTYNQESFTNFLIPATLGFVSKSKHATGFEPHGFRFAMPKLSIEPKPNADPLEFNLREMPLNRLELVSLLNFETPRVYVLDHLPRMDQLRGSDLETRELDSFEKSGLERLIAGENLVTQRTGTSFRMMGAIPAINQCLQCHEGQVGNLLGAFSYEFK